MPRTSLLLGLLLLPSGSIAGQARPPYRDPTLPVSARVHDLLGRMTLTEKFWQLFMLPDDLADSTHDYSHGVFGLQVPPAATARADAERINAIQRYFIERTRLGIPIVPFDEAVHGLTRPGATVFPAAIALAATWDTALVARVARAIAQEARTRGIRQVLAPVLNVASDVRWGRVEETYGEDPFLVSEMGRAYVGAFEAAGIVATPKHFVANVGEGGRDSYPIDWSERALAETYFPPFRVAIQQAGAGSVMAAYNSVDGVPASQNRWLLTDRLRRRWGFTGFVISDASGTGGATVLHHTEASTATAVTDALEAGLDVVFQSHWREHGPYLEAFRRGLIPDSVVDTAVARVLRAKVGLGLFEDPWVSPDSAAVANGSPDHRRTALEAARASLVLLRNRRAVLPLRPGIRSLAVIGADAAEGRLGGYSGPGAGTITILDGIRAAAGPGVTVGFAPGPGRRAVDRVVVPSRQLHSGTGEAGLRGAYFENIALVGTPRMVRTDPTVDFRWTLSGPAPGIPSDWYSVRWTGNLTIPAGGVHRIGVEGTDGYRLWLDGRLLIDNWRKRSAGAVLRPVTFRPGSTHAVRLEYFETTGNARVRLVWDAGVRQDWRARIAAAERLAARSDVALVVAGIEEGEFRDRALLGLPGHQEDLIRAVAGTGKPVVVVLVGGSAITMSGWLDRVDGVLLAWYPGQEGGRAVAEALFGRTDPGGRLPLTFPLAEGQLPLSYRHKPTGRGDDYVDLTGRPLFPFGYGLSYTRFEFTGLGISPDTIAPGGTARVSCRVRNAGSRAGDEVVQLYLHDELASVAQPVEQLAGFQRIRLEPGEEREVVFRLGPDRLALLDRQLHRVVEPGDFRIMVGASSQDIRLQGRLTVR